MTYISKMCHVEEALGGLIVLEAYISKSGFTLVEGMGRQLACRRKYMEVTVYISDAWL